MRQGRAVVVDDKLAECSAAADVVALGVVVKHADVLGSEADGDCAAFAAVVDALRYV
ncbi:MAG: hypothetical protein ACO3O3_12785 [Ilumatobacteraceae bacterium]